MQIVCKYIHRIIFMLDRRKNKNEKEFTENVNCIKVDIYLFWKENIENWRKILLIINNFNKLYTGGVWIVWITFVIARNIRCKAIKTITSYPQSYTLYSQKHMENSINCLFCKFNIKNLQGDKTILSKEKNGKKYWKQTNVRI